MLSIGARIKNTNGFYVARRVKILFAKLEDDKDIYKIDKFLVSNHSNYDGSFLLNAAPGTYVAIAAQHVYDKDDENRTQIGSIIIEDGASVVRTVVFPEEAIKLSKTTVKGNSVAFMGSFTILMRSSVNEAMDSDAAQDYFRNTLLNVSSSGTEYDHSAAKTNKSYHLLHGEPVNHADEFEILGSRFDLEKQYENDELKFLQENERSFEGTTWHELFSRRIGEMKKK